MGKQAKKKKKRPGKEKGTRAPRLSRLWAFKKELGVLFLVALAVLTGLAVYGRTAGAALAFIERQAFNAFGIGAYAAPPLLTLLSVFIVRPHPVVRLVLCHGAFAVWFVMTFAHLARLPSEAVCLSGDYLRSAGGYLGGAGACGLYRAAGRLGGAVLMVFGLVVYVGLFTPIGFAAMIELALDVLKIVFYRMGAIGKPALRMVLALSARMDAARAKAVQTAKERHAAIPLEPTPIAPPVPAVAERGEPAPAGNGRRAKRPVVAPIPQAPAAPASAVQVDEDEFHLTDLPPLSAWDERMEAKSKPAACSRIDADLGEAERPGPAEARGEETPAVQQTPLPEERPEEEEAFQPIRDEAPEDSFPLCGEVEDERTEEDEQLKKLGLELDVGAAEVGETSIALSEEEVEWWLPGADEWLDPVDLDHNPVPDMSLKTRLEATLQNFSVPARVVNLVRGASFTRCEVALEPGVKVNRISGLENDIAYALAASPIRIEAPIPGKSLVGVEVPNKETTPVPLRKIFESESFRNSKDILSVVVGEDIAGVPAWASLSKMPHLLVAGSTGSGKSVCLNALLCSLISRRTPEDVRLILIDMKRVELTPYNGLPHLIAPVVKEPTQAANALRWALGEMEARYKLFAETGVRNIDGYNGRLQDQRQRLYRIVIVIDELADLMMTAGANLNVEGVICRIAQMARATGIHLILATQRPDTKVITGTIKANIPSRIAFAVASQIDSRTILDVGGAESLLGRGDMLFMPADANKLIRIQGSFVSDGEIHRLVQFWKAQGTPEFVAAFAEETGKGGTFSEDDKFTTEDEALYKKAVEVVVTTNQASISAIQRRLRIGYNRAARLVELMEERGVVGPYDGSKPREIMLTAAGFDSGQF